MLDQDRFVKVPWAGRVNRNKNALLAPMSESQGVSSRVLKKLSGSGETIRHSSSTHGTLRSVTARLAQGMLAVITRSCELCD